MTRKCSHCGNNGHNSRTCPNRGGGAGGGSLGGGGGLKLFGVRLTDGPIRKSASMGNLVAMNLNHSLNHNVDEGYQSDGFVQASSSNQARERKKGVPWTEEEHRMFLVGLQKLGKGDWRGIARKYVISRTPTQVASHAQKYFIRQTNVTRRKRRSSLFDMIPESDRGTMMMGGEENTADHMNENSAEHQMHRLGHPTCENTTQNLMPSTNQIAQNQLQSGTVLNPLFGQGTSAETNNRMMVPSTPASDQECESLPPSNQVEDEATFSQAPVPIACAVPVMFPGFIQPMFPYPFPVWGTGYRPNTTELPPNCNVVKPRAQVLTTPLNIEDAGISKLSIGDTPARIEPSDLSLKLMNRPSSQSAFHANPPVSSSSLGSSSNAIHVN